MRTAFLFPGQGNQEPGMGRQFYESWAVVRETFDRLDSRLDYPVADLCFRADAERLRRTRFAQPAVFATGAAVAQAVVDRYDPEPALVAGHSLGQFTAAAHAGLFAAGDGAELVAERGAAMARAAAAEGPGEMVAVLFVAPEAVRETCADIDGVAVAAYNTDRQTVISGTVDAVAAAREAIEDGRFRALDVGAAFHSPVMEPAVGPVAAALDATPMDPASVPVVSDVSAAAYERPPRAREELREQVLGPLDWVGVTRTLRRHRVERVVEFPPAGTLSEFVARTAPEMTVERLDTPADAAAVFED